MDFFKDEDPKRRACAEEETARAAPPLPTPIECNLFYSLPVEKPRSIVDGLFDNASRIFFGGGSKTYKTWGMTDMALSIATGTPWLAFATHQTPILYVNFELKDYYLKFRLQQIQQAKDLALPNDMLFVWNLRGYSIGLPQFKAEALAFIQAHQIGTVFIDPFYKLLGAGDERISAELVPILAAFDEVNRVAGASTVTAAHYSKGNQSSKEPLDRISGGGYIGRDPDALITLTNHQEEGAFILDFSLRDHAPVKPFVVRWNAPLLERTDLDPTKIKQMGRSEQLSAEELLVVIDQHDDEFGTNELQKFITTELGWARSTFFRKLAQLKKAKKIFLSKQTDHWCRSHKYAPV